jgi:uncharacterized protein YcbK (DUF882 family)
LKHGQPNAYFTTAQRGFLVFASLVLTLLIPRPTQNAIANGETRALTLYHTHTRESLSVTFKRDGRFDSDALSKLNWFLRDWRNDEPTSMAPELFDIVWQTYRESGAKEPIQVVSAYRSPGTNAMLSRRSNAVAKDSHHMRGNAMDFFIPDLAPSKIREIAMRLQRGGVGYYPGAGSAFVHLDVGTVRAWPRMTRDQLERLFPDGKTVHLPSDGVPLANYQAALSEIQARGGAALDLASVTNKPAKSLWALLFGLEQDEDRQAQRAREASRPKQAASVAATPERDENEGTAAPDSAPIRVSGVPLPPPVPRGQERLLTEAQSLPLPPMRPATFEPETPPGVEFTAVLPLPPQRPAMAGSSGSGAVLSPTPRGLWAEMLHGARLQETKTRAYFMPEPTFARAIQGPILAYRLVQPLNQSGGGFKEPFIRPLGASFQIRGE